MNERLNKFYLKIKRLLYYFYGEKFFKQLNYDWSKYPSRSFIINKVIKERNYRSYLEIGCDKNKNYGNIEVEKKIGVDPNIGGTHKMTSDEFFKKNKDNFDIVFIDGLHECEQVDRDIENSLKFLNPKGIILLHDCLPIKIWHQIVPSVYPKWNGDVWKSIVKARTKTHINTYTIIADHGIGVIFREKNRKPLKLDIKNFKKLKYEEYYKNHSEFMNLISVDKFFSMLKLYN